MDKMTNTNVLVGGSNVNGVISNCGVNSTDVSLNSFYTETISVNSCTGEKLSDNSYFNWSNLGLGGLVVCAGLLMGTLFFVMYKMITDF